MRDHHEDPARAALDPTPDLEEPCAADAAEVEDWEEFLAALDVVADPTEEDLLSKLRALLGC